MDFKDPGILLQLGLSALRCCQWVTGTSLLPLPWPCVSSAALPPSRDLGLKLSFLVRSPRCFPIFNSAAFPVTFLLVSRPPSLAFPWSTQDLHYSSVSFFVSDHKQVLLFICICSHHFEELSVLLVYLAQLLFIIITKFLIKIKSYLLPDFKRQENGYYIL